MSWDVRRLSLEKTKLPRLQAGEKRMSDGKQAFGEGRQKKRGFPLVLAHGSSLHACVILTSFSLQCGNLWHPEPRKYKQMSPGRPAHCCSLQHRHLLHARFFITNSFFCHLCISIILNSFPPPPPTPYSLFSTQSQRMGESGFNALTTWGWYRR